jgi:mannose-6-phosphate isomerase-like protein (cupin superfamily)
VKVDIEMTGITSSIQQGYAAYTLMTDPEGDKWSIAILDVIDAEAHFHEIENEHFMVLNGELEITVDGVQHRLTAGQTVHIQPGNIHHLKSTSDTPVRLLCVNFPAFDLADFHPVK